METVPHVLLNWERLEGETLELKKLNSLLVSELHGVHEAPQRRFVDHAETIHQFFLSNLPNWEILAAEYLSLHFDDADFNETLLLAERAKNILTEGRWPDRLFLV